MILMTKRGKAASLFPNLELDAFREAEKDRP